jgi:hypothetical protein
MRRAPTPLALATLLMLMSAQVAFAAAPVHDNTDIRRFRHDYREAQCAEGKLPAPYRARRFARP